LRKPGWFAAIGLLAAAAGIGLWWGTRVPREPSAVTISPGALWAATFSDTALAVHSLGELQGKVLVLNFWATWCAPCREEMPAFSRLHERWKGRGVAFLGLSDEDPARVEPFGRELSISYPLWVGGESVGELGRRLGNRLGALPYTVIIDPGGSVVDMKVGPYTEAELDQKLGVMTGK
jgi:thiol-disulfide isomerase/thioredoxin